MTDTEHPLDDAGLVAHAQKPSTAAPDMPGAPQTLRIAHTAAGAYANIADLAAVLATLANREHARTGQRRREGRATAAALLGVRSAILEAAASTPATNRRPPRWRRHRP